MDSKQINAKYTFTMGGINFDVEIDDSLSAEYRAKKYPESNKKSLHYHPLHEVFFVFDEGISVVFEDGTKEFKNCILCIPPNTKHFTNRTSDYRLLFSCNANGPVKDGFSNFFKNIFTSSIFCVPAIKQDVKVSSTHVISFDYFVFKPSRAMISSTSSFVHFSWRSEEIFTRMGYFSYALISEASTNMYFVSAYSLGGRAR